MIISTFVVLSKTRGKKGPKIVGGERDVRCAKRGENTEDNGGAEEHVAVARACQLKQA